MGRILITRHGQTHANQNQIVSGRGDEALTMRGILQVKDLTRILKNYPVEYIISSPLMRDTQTACICRAELRVLPSTTMDSLVDRNNGVLEGRPYSEIPRLAQKYFQAEDGSMYIVEAEGCETFTQMYERARVAIRELREEVEEKNIVGDTLVVCSGLMVRAIYGVEHDVPVEDILKIPKLLIGAYRVL